MIDVGKGEGQVLGQGRVTLLAGDKEAYVEEGDRFDLQRLGAFRSRDLLATVPKQVASDALAASVEETSELAVPGGVLTLAHERQAARVRRDWAGADRLRNEIEALGWRVEDTPEGPAFGLCRCRNNSADGHATREVCREGDFGGPLVAATL